MAPMSWVSQYLVALVLLSFVFEGDAASINDWRSRSVYQIITDRFARTDGSTTAPCILDDKVFCGGTWQGIINHLDYIQGMGFSAIWISPVVENIQGNNASGEPYHGFWSRDITKLNSNFGTADDLKGLSKALHNRDMLLMVDIVVNDFAYAGPGQDTVFSDFVPFNSSEYFHPFCYISNYSNDTNVQQCWLGDNTVALPDMNTELDSVKSIWGKWAKDMIANYSIDGFRIDAVKHVAKPFWTDFQKAANIYTLGEVYSTDIAATCDYASNALSAVLNYPMWFTFNSTFLSTPPANMTILQQEYNDITTTCQDTTLFGSFTENQDQGRLAHFTNDTSLLKSALTFALLSDGIPIVYYGAEQKFAGASDPYNREALWGSNYNTSSPLYTAIAAINAARKAVASNAKYAYWSPYWTWKTKMVAASGEMVALRKGYDHSIVAIMTNRGQRANLGPYTIVDTNFVEGDGLLDVLSCNTQTAGQYGAINATIVNGEPQVWIKTPLMANSTVCPKVDKTAKRTPNNNGGAANYASVGLLTSLCGLLFCFLS